MKCSYCTQEIEKGKGLIYVRKNGNIRYFCSNRCYKLSVRYNKKPNAKELKQFSPAAAR